MAEIDPITEEERDEARWKMQRRFEDEDGNTDIEPETEWWARLAAMLPNDMGADWVGTNHYELNSEEVTINGIRWGGCRGIGPQNEYMDLSGTEFGQMLGLVMEAACAFKAVHTALAQSQAKEAELREALLSCVERLSDLREVHGVECASPVTLAVAHKALGKRNDG